MIIYCPNYISINCSYSLRSYNFFCKFNSKELHEKFPYIGSNNLLNIEAGNTTIEILIYENIFSQYLMLSDIAVRLRGNSRSEVNSKIDDLIFATEVKTRSFIINPGRVYAPNLIYDQLGSCAYLGLSDQKAIYNIELGDCVLFLDADEELCGAAFRGVSFDDE